MMNDSDKIIAHQILNSFSRFASCNLSFGEGKEDKQGLAVTGMQKLACCVTNTKRLGIHSDNLLAANDSKCYQGSSKLSCEQDNAIFCRSLYWNKLHKWSRTVYASRCGI